MCRTKPVVRLLNPEPVAVRKVGLITGGPNPHQMRACLAYVARLAPMAQRDHRTHAIARREADATAKEEQKRLLHIPSPPTPRKRGKSTRTVIRSRGLRPI